MMHDSTCATAGTTLIILMIFAIRTAAASAANCQYLYISRACNLKRAVLAEHKNIIFCKLYKFISA